MGGDHMYVLNLPTTSGTGLGVHTCRVLALSGLQLPQLETAVHQQHHPDAPSQQSNGGLCRSTLVLRPRAISMLLSSYCINGQQSL
jgi:hypothetical protein